MYFGTSFLYKIKKLYNHYTELMTIAIKTIAHPSSCAPDNVSLKNKYPKTAANIASIEHKSAVRVATIRKYSVEKGWYKKCQKIHILYIIPGVCS